MNKSGEYLTNENTKETYYYSFSEEIAKLDFLALFEQAEQAQWSKFFWQTPSQEEQFLGLGTLASYQEVSVAALQQIKAQLASRWQTINPIKNFEESKLPQAILFGGLAFDEQAGQSTIWQELAQGYFVVPAILLQKTPRHTYVHYNVQAKDLDSAKVAYEQLKKAFITLQSASLQAKVKLAPALKTPITWQYVEEDAWLQLAKKTIAQLRQSNTTLKKVVLARRLQFEASHFKASCWLANLISQQPNTYRFFLEGASRIFAGATPERLLKATATHFQTASVAGSIRRGKTISEDEQLAEQLLNDPKNSHEHQIVVARIERQLADYIEGRLTLGKRTILKNRMIQHIFLPLEGKRKAEVDFLSVIKALHPTPALGGEPKKDAMDWLRQYEGFHRGLYGAPIGWQSILSDEGEFAVGIRSAVIAKDQPDSYGQLFAGCGIVADSNPEEELQETALKFEPMKRSLAINEPSTSDD